MLKNTSALQKAKHLNNELSFVVTRIRDKDWRLLASKISFQLVLTIADYSKSGVSLNASKCDRLLNECIAILLIIRELEGLSDKEFIKLSVMIDEIRELIPI